MYRSCLFCSADLGANQALEEFPVGRALAFDAWKGRLWAVCPKCARWNLAPIEERWEAVESSEKLFRDSRLRAQSENIGLAKLPDGTRLIRVGEALPGELAAWRYGGQFLRRRRQHLVVATALGVAITAWGGLAVAGVLGASGALFSWGNLFWQHRRGQRMVYRVPGEESPTGAELPLRRVDLNGARVTPGEDGTIALRLPHALPPERTSRGNGRYAWLPPPPVVLQGSTARRVLERAMVDANARGASRRKLGSAVELLAEAGNAEAYLRRTSQTGLALGVPYVARSRGMVGVKQVLGTFRGDYVAPDALPRGRHGMGSPGWLNAGDRLSRIHALALEMALHEETERRALAGELAALEAAWREAEEIAGIADTLLGDPLNRLAEESA